MDSYYNTIGVPKNAGDKEIRKAFRKLARKYHPDLNPGDKEAENKFKRINEAYEVLSDSESRKKYDRYGENWKHADRIEAQYRSSAGAPFDRTYRGGIEDLFESDTFAGFGDLFGRRGRASTATRIEGSVEVDLEEAYSGAKRQVTITSAGKDRRIEVSIPPGVDTGSVVRISPGKGPGVAAQHHRHTTQALYPHGRRPDHRGRGASGGRDPGRGGRRPDAQRQGPPQGAGGEPERSASPAG